MFEKEIRSFNLGHQKISDDDLSNIVESLQHVEELRLVLCGVSRNLVAALAERWKQTKPQIRDLNLSNIGEIYGYELDERRNQIGDKGLSCLIGCLQFVRRLGLSNCDISSTGVKMLADKLLETGLELEYLDLSHNPRIDDVGARSLIPYLHLIKKLDFDYCDVTKAVKEEIRSELKSLGLREDRVDFAFQLSDTSDLQ